MDDWQRELLIRNRVKLVKGIQMNNVMYAELRSRNIIGSRQEQRWKHLGCNEAQVEELLDHLARRPEEEYWGFIEALKSSEPSHQAIIHNILLPNKVDAQMKIQNSRPSMHYPVPKDKGKFNGAIERGKATGASNIIQESTSLLPQKKFLSKNRLSLVQGITLDDSLYLQLRTREIIDWTQEQQLRHFTSNELRTESLLSLVEQVSEQKFKEFCRALHECHPSQGYLVDIYLSQPQDGAYNSVPNGSAEYEAPAPVSGNWKRELLTRNRVQLVERMNMVSSGLYNILRAKGVITLREEQDWKHIGAEHSQAEAMLNYITYKRPDAFPTFCQALIDCRPTQRHLVDTYLTDRGNHVSYAATNLERPHDENRKRRANTSISEEGAAVKNHTTATTSNKSSNESGVKNGLKELVTCSICFEIFQNPKGLPCQHNFCLHCLQEYTQATHANGTFSCPICRARITIPDGGLGSLPNALAIQNLLVLI